MGKKISDEPLPFSQREGLEPVPPQLSLGEVTKDFRRRLDYCLSLEIERETRFGYASSYFSDSWKRVARDFHVLHRKLPASSFQNSPHDFRRRIEKDITGLGFARLFDLVEFFAGHEHCSAELKRDIAEVFVKSRSAYRLVDGLVLAVGTEAQAHSFQEALAETEAVEANSARRHLVLSARELRDGNWASSVRESIHSVEAIAKLLAPESPTLGAALKSIEQKGHLHGSLKAAFLKLYGYSSDEAGVRHALVFGENAQVDETDALFMLGACASFVSYLVSRGSNPQG